MCFPSRHSFQVSNENEIEIVQSWGRDANVLSISWKNVIRALVHISLARIDCSARVRIQGACVMDSNTFAFARRRKIQFIRYFGITMICKLTERLNTLRE